MEKTIYFADDDADIRQIIETFLKNSGYQVRAFSSGDALLEAFAAQAADLVILDIMMEGTDGLSICAKLREEYNVPIIIVSARDSELDRITGITMGSDDYLTKPFSPMELVARVQALFRRLDLDRANTSGEQLAYGDMLLAPSTREAYINKEKIDITPTEFALLEYMFTNADRAVSREELLQKVWKFNFDVDTRATDNAIKRLRKKIGASSVVIESVWGFGFKLGEKNE